MTISAPQELCEIYNTCYSPPKIKRTLQNLKRTAKVCWVLKDLRVSFDGNIP